jgi:hypothetical protein
VVLHVVGNMQGDKVKRIVSTRSGGKSKGKYLKNYFRAVKSQEYSRRVDLTKAKIVM